MRVMSCLHPSVVRNPYTGEEVVVRCGKCSACLNTRAALWVQKIDEESRHHKYSLFCTIQYDELNVPQMIRLRKEDTPFVDGEYSWSYIDSDTSQIISFDHPSITRHRKADKQYVFDTKVLLVLSKSDIQKFIKRLRYYIYELTGTYCSLRYFITGEYGPSTFRPHYHAILWFDDQRIAKEINSLLSKSWKFGNIYDPHFIHGSSAEYVASYVNCTTHLPSIYTHECIRPFSLFSKSPAIGTISFLRDDYKRIFFERLDKIRLFKASSSEFCDVPLWRSIQDRCFPRIPRFACLPNSLRVSLYNFGLRFFESDCQDTRTFTRWLKIYYVDRYSRGYRKDELAHYFYDISHVPYYDRLSKTQSVRFSENPLINFVRIVRRCCVTAYAYNLPIRDYVNNIVEFYDTLKMSNYVEQLRFEDDYFRKHPDEKHALYFDYAFIHRVNGKHVSELSPTDRFYLETNMLIDSSTDIVSLDLSDCFDYVDCKSMHEKIQHTNTKTKKMNDYLYSRSDKFENVINYYKNLEDI